MKKTTAPTATATEKTYEISPAKAELISISETVRLLQQMGQIEVYSTLNEALIQYYRKTENDEELVFKTFNQWKEEGFSVIKGSKAFKVWTSKITAKKGEATEGAGGDEQGKAKEYKFFNVCCLFSSNQVEKK
jgi:hypothetical protein